MKYKLWAITGLVLSAQVLAEIKIDKTESLNGVELKSGKEKSIRSYTGFIDKSFPYPLQLVKKGITNFPEKCNNNLRNKRKFISPEINCKYHNENLIESFIVNDIKPIEEYKNVSEKFLVGRKIYNRGSYGYYDLVLVEEGLNEKKQKTVSITLRMLQDQEVKRLTNPKFKKDSAFDHSQSVFKLTELSPTQTQVAYEYSADTDHWILNKEVSVPQVFASISKSINDLMRAVEEESSFQNRALAAEQE